MSGLPGGVTAGFSPASLNQAASTTLTLQTSTNTSGGSYSVTITGTNGVSVLTTNVTLVVNGLVANAGPLFWTAGSSAGTNWSTALNWTNPSAGGLGPPGISNDLFFNNTGAVPASNTPSSVVDNVTVVSSLTFTDTNSYHTVVIAPGQTLTLSGTNGLTVGTETDLGTAATVNSAIAGDNAALIFSNASANVLVRQWTAGASGGTQRSTLDLSGLDTFMATAKSIEVGDYPANGTARSAGTLYLAQTNILNLLASGQGVTTNAGIDVGDNPMANSSQFSFLYLGQQNTINADGITVGGGRNMGWMGFNPVYDSSSVVIRGTNGPSSRVTRWLVGDNSGASNTGSNSRGTNDFTGGTIDALVNTMILGKGESPTMNTGNSTGMVAFASGTINVNTLLLGVQASGSTGGGGGTIGTTNYVGQMDVDGTATLIVNSNLVLSSQAGGAGGYALRGTLNINGGTVEATNILHGGGVAGTSIINLNSGLLDLQPAWAAAPGQIVNVTILNIGSNGVGDPALLANAASISASNTITVAANGTLAGNTFITAPGLVVNGAISPGTTGVGAITNNGPVTLGAGGSYLVTASDATAGSGAGWSFLQASGGMNVQSSGGNPFLIQLQDAPPTANFNFNTNFDWVIATANGGIANYSPAALAVDDSLFANDLGGGYFYVRSNNSSLVLSFTNNHPPVAGPTTLMRTAIVMTIPLSTLSTQWNDPDNDPVTLSGVSTSSGAGSNNISTDGTNIYYTNLNNVLDAFTYTIADVRTNPPAVYRTGDTVQTAVGSVTILPTHPSISNPVMQGGSLILSGSGGVPNMTYYVLSSTNLALPPEQWTIVATNQFDGNGQFNFTNAPVSGAPQQFYMLQTP